MTLRQAFAIVAFLCISAIHADDLVDRADANGDGFVSLYELRAAHYADIEFNKRIEQSFADYDSNGDGLISEDERNAKRNSATAGAARRDQPVSDIVAGPAAGTTPDAGPATGMVAAPVAFSSGNADPITAKGANPVAAPSPDDLPATGATVAAPTDEDADLRGQSGDTARLSRTETWILQIDADASGGASIAELIGSGGGEQWFTDEAFESADENGDRDLDPDELEVFMQSMERRRRSVR